MKSGQEMCGLFHCKIQIKYKDDVMVIWVENVPVLYFMFFGWYNKYNIIINNKHCQANLRINVMHHSIFVDCWAVKFSS